MVVENPAGAWIDKDPVCRACLKMDEEVTLFRGIIDPITQEDAAEKEIICARCGKKLPT